MPLRRRRLRLVTLALIEAAMLGFAVPPPCARAQAGDGASSAGAPTSRDEAVSRDAVTRYRGAPSASEFLASEGWDWLRRNRQDLALQRFQQSWRLDPKNYQALWGFGAVLSEQGKLADAIEQLESARELIDDPAQRVSLLADLGNVYSEHAARLPADDELGRARQFILANHRFAESLEIDPRHAPSWRAWALSLFAQERYSEAWIKAERARELQAEPFPAGFLDKLREKLPELR